MIWLGTMECAGYRWTVVDRTKERCREALLAEYRQRVERGSITDVADGDPEEYFGIGLTAMKPGKVEWL